MIYYVIYCIAYIYISRGPARRLLMPPALGGPLLLGPPWALVVLLNSSIDVLAREAIGEDAGLVELVDALGLPDLLAA